MFRNPVQVKRWLPKNAGPCRLRKRGLELPATHAALAWVGASRSVPLSSWLLLDASLVLSEFSLGLQVAPIIQ